MTWAEYMQITSEIDTAIKREKEYCRRYCELNPSDSRHRETIRDAKVEGLNEALRTINIMYQHGRLEIK